MTTISLVMIVKNEELALPACLESVRGLVDEYVIVDTGSTDGTQDVIARYTDARHEMPFTDFVKTKNAALELATGDYILFMDADERLLTGHVLLRQAADEGAAGVGGLILEGEPGRWSNEYYRMRLWPNTGGWRFVGPGVHEVLSGPGENVLWTRDVTVQHDHSHRTPASYQARYGQYVALLTAALEREPGDTRALFYLARTHMDAGQWLTAIDTYRRYRAVATWRDEIWQSWYDEAVCWMRLGEYSHARAALIDADSVDPRRAEAACLAGDLSFSAGEWQEAARHYERAAALPQPTDVLLFLNPLAYTVQPHDQLVLVYDQLRRFDLGLPHAAAAAAVGKPQARLVRNLQYIRQQHDRRWLFALGLTPEPIYGTMLETVGGGGVETTYIELPKHLAAAGQTVAVLCRCEEPHVVDGVYFLPYEQEFDLFTPDVVVASRWYDKFTAYPDAKRLLWLQDAWFAEPPSGLWDMSTRVVVSSPWHRTYVAQRAGWPVVRKTDVIPLGIRKAAFTDRPTKRPYQVVYSSNPDRGLDTLVASWPEIMRRVPDVNLVVTYGWEGLLTWSSDPAWRQQQEARRERLLGWAADAGNVTFTGRLSKPALYSVLAESSLCAYPNNFWETFCLTALECQAAGTPLVTSSIGALPTTCDTASNILLGGDPLGSDYQARFASECAALLLDQERLVKLSAGCLAHVEALPCDWSDIAGRWLRLAWEI